MKKYFNCLILILAVMISLFNIVFVSNKTASAADTTKKYYTVYADSKKEKVLFLRGDEVSVGDRYLSGNNKLYEIETVDSKEKIAIAKFLKDEILPEISVQNETNNNKAAAASTKKIGVYHTHNDESYFTPDGIDSVYGKGGIHDVGKKFVSELNNIGVETVYREDLHLPHNSGAYTRSQVTATALLDSGATAIFDLHRDSTKRSEYLTKVDGKQMSSVRMVVGSSSKNYEENKKFAYTIKSYADKTYPGLIKDIYFGKGNYNQGLTTKAMLFEMGCENIEKDLVLKTTPYLAKTVTAVLFGTSTASTKTANETAVVSETTNSSSSQSGSATGVNDSMVTNESVNSNETLFVVIGIIGFVIVLIGLIMIFSRKARQKVGRFFSETFAGIFGKKKAE